MLAQIKIAIEGANTFGMASVATAAEHWSNEMLGAGKPATAHNAAVNAERRRGTGCGAFVLISERPIQ
jgi:hypothetical protein